MIDLTKEELLKYVKELSEKKITLQELKAGLVAVHGWETLGPMPFKEAQKMAKEIYGVDLPDIPDLS